ncbi:MAG: aminopeptidase [Chitinophaga sp.]|uniref:M1 family metallopeptidase n=1 Tax=Chitinophaga sp. TaxID=1869181 RepID=UPI0025BFFA2A|nr:M1 family aminopeptidase [Chitinophaga sp.]MBV8251829.1 aminopeptidase [Chitinophaga sp.]
MKIFYKSLICLLAVTPAAFAQPKPIPVTTGVSLELATYRYSVIGDITYTLHFHIPNEKATTIPAKEKLEFTLKEVSQPLQLDFKQPVENITRLVVNSVATQAVMSNEHLLIPTTLLKTGKNNIELEFTAGEGSLNRNAEFLYALFVPDRARFVFPCFDQPDLKAVFQLSMEVPSDWKVLANGWMKDSLPTPANYTAYTFAPTEKLPTYLFSFTTGKYSVAQQDVNGKPATLLYREKDPGTNIDSVFQLHRDAVKFLEQWTGIPFPFQKMGFAAIPDFQFGGMEHPGEVQYKASALFLQNPTKDQLLARTNLISHETAHMWFGDLVTMKWFNDVWMKEVFANFMADKVAEDILGSKQFNLRFQQDHYPRAYNVDRTAGANPIRQQLENLQDAGTMYGDIIYHKAPIMMRQIELLMGKDNFRKGVQEYLKTYAYGNASWNDMIAILAKFTKADLYKWNNVWVNQPGRPVFDYKMTTANGKIKQFTITQHPESGEKRLWPQVFDIALVYGGGMQESHTYPVTVEELRVNMNDFNTVVKAAVGKKKPDYILFNSSGLGYGLFPSDSAATIGMFELAGSVWSATAYVTAYENALAGRTYKPNALLRIFVNGLFHEKEETNLKLLTNYISTLFWEFTTPAERAVFGPELEKQMWEAMQQQTLTNNKKLLLKAYQDIYTTPDAGKRIYDIWEQQQPPKDIKLSEEDYISLALTIALKTDTAANVLATQRDRLKDNDKKDRLNFLMPALSAKVAERDQFFASLHDKKGRAKESWVVTALYFLNHPLRQATAMKYLPESLLWLEDIQRTGDIFFPANWLGAVFGYYQSPEAWKVVTDFLATHPDYNPKLKNKILQATDNLHRAQLLLQ